MSNTDTIVVFTARSADRIIREGGSQAWVLNPVRARQCRYLVCTQNQHHPDHEFSDATEPHGTGFLIGKISRLTPAAHEPDRWLIEIDEYARINTPDLWDGSRNPVRYTDLKELGIDVDALEFEKMPQKEVESLNTPASAATEAAGLTIAQAKAGLAATYGVQPDAIEIVIRG
ncbi:hypothetical protein C5E51_34420 [Nocardia nova]|uniref:hypothetical protein n=1 Tax=Nocardia nova TaxID=37330 RepID=UPI000CEA3919|nr:hypothetical protein [Nocardia nova]PPJ01213.1 hypothetical protein C5E51_34420 [Nocardia nova]